ncbi:hypothetical protein MHBO_000443 [Bonamia ostreae]|uniref:Transposase IS204/IS1001/IS1096/IS1165 DDE domain-containing protein n=1 Tax=Bonamia ostreae TaxID=126728 RepID=A0ABV2AFN8_9EUKA
MSCGKSPLIKTFAFVAFEDGDRNVISRCADAGVSPSGSREIDALQTEVAGDQCQPCHRSEQLLFDRVHFLRAVRNASVSRTVVSQFQQNLAPLVDRVNW